MDEVITPLVGSNTSNTSVGAIQSFGNSISCVFSNGTCNITANPTATACSGWFLVKIGNTIRDVYKCLRVIIVDGIGFWEDLFTGQNVSTRILRFLKDGVWCLVTTLITDILDLILTFVGSLLDLIFNTGNSITTFLHNIGTGITTVINILNGLFFQVGQAINCSTCWSVCLSDTWDSIPHSGDPTHAVCSNCWCKCKCQRPTLDGLPCRIDWDGDSHTNDQEVFTPVTAQANCTALGYTYKKKRDLLQSAEYMDLIASHNPDVLSSNNAIPSAALGRARNINATLQELFQWKHMYEEVTQSSSSSSVCTDLMLQIHEKAQKMSPNDNSIDRLLADYSFSDKALFTGCYSLLVAPSLLNDPSGSMMKRSFSSEGPLNSVMSLLKIPKYLFMDSKQLDHFMQASNDALQTYVEWQSNAGLMTVSPVLLQQYIESNSNSSVILYNQTLLTPEQIQKKRAILARFSTFMVRGSPPALIHKREMAAAMDTHIAVHSRSFNDALYLSMTTHHPNVDLFVNQLAQYNLNEKAANQLGELLNRAHQSTVLDGLIEFTQGLRTFTGMSLHCFFLFIIFRST